MKKLTKIISVLALLFSLFAALGSGLIETAEAVDDEVVVTLHKKKMTTLPDPLIQNTGSEMADFAAYDDMPNVEFTVHDVTAQFYALRAGTPSLSVDAAMAAVAATPTPNPIGTGTTGADGRVSFTLPSKSGGLDAVYVFVETDAPSGTTTAANLALVLPMYDTNDKIMKDILLYPKNVVAADGTVTVTKKGTADGTVLPDADFIVSRELTTGNVEYLGEFNSTLGLNNWVADRDDARVFRTGATGQITISNLEHGDYNLIEIAAPGNASIIDDGITEFTIGENATTLAFDVFNDTILVDKDRADKDDYNVGDLIPYSITVNIPEGMGYQFPDDTYRHPTMTITDAPDVGLQFNDDLALTAGTTNIVIDDSWMDTSGNGFVLTIPAAALAAFEGQDLTLNYHMYLDGNAGPDIGYNNLATVATDELTDNDFTPDVYTGGYRFLKIDANFAENNELEGAIFVVGRGSGADIEYLLMVDNDVTWITDIDTATEFESDADGMVEVAGLEYGDYWLRETVAPEGYVLPDGLVNFTITEGTFTNDELILPITNVHEGRLPSTGGSGIVGIVALGAALVATTGGYYIKRKRDE